MNSQAPLLIALETSTKNGAVALAAGPRLLAKRILSPGGRNASEIMPALAEMIAEQGAQPRDIQIVCYSGGPGSFTGLRVAATIASTWQMSTSAAVVRVPTIEVVAQNAYLVPSPPAYAAILLESKPGFAYCSFGSIDGPAPYHGIAEVRRPDEWLPTLTRPFAVFGDGLRHWKEYCEREGFPMLDAALWAPRVEEVAALGWRMFQAGKTCQPHEITPLYARPPECEEVYEQRRAAARARRGE